MQIFTDYVLSTTHCCKHLWDRSWNKTILPTALGLGNHSPKRKTPLGAGTQSFHFPYFSQCFGHNKCTVNNSLRFRSFYHVNVFLIPRTVFSTRPSVSAQVTLGRQNNAFTPFLISHRQCFRSEAEVLKSPTQYKYQLESQNLLKLNHGRFQQKEMICSEVQKSQAEEATS